MKASENTEFLSWHALGSGQTGHVVRQLCELFIGEYNYTLFRKKRKDTSEREIQVLQLTNLREGPRG